MVEGDGRAVVGVFDYVGRGGDAVEEGFGGQGEPGEVSRCTIMRLRHGFGRFYWEEKPLGVVFVDRLMVGTFGAQFVAVLWSEVVLLRIWPSPQ